MQFSLKRLLILFAFANFLIAAAFVFPPVLSMIVLTFVSLVVLPPFVIVGVVNTRGCRQAFFLGAMVTGIPHFVLAMYTAVAYGLTLDYNDLMSAGDDETWIFGAMHLGFITLGALGGAMGMASYALLGIKPREEPLKDFSSNQNKLTSETWLEGKHPIDATPKPVKLPR